MIGQSYPFMPVLVLFAHDFTEHFVVAGSIVFEVTPETMLDR